MTAPMTDPTMPFRFPANGGYLSPAMQDSFARYGVLILEDFVSAAACEQLRQRAEALVADFEPDQITIFSTRSSAHAASEYFLHSGDQVRFFFEEDAFAADGQLTRPKPLAINKIGHALHDREPVFNNFSRTPELSTLAGELGLVEPRLLQSMYIFKQPGVGGEVGMHQDATFLYTEPLSCIGLWFALEDASVDNGCLLACPGHYPLRARFHRSPEGLVTDSLDDTPWPEADAIPLEVRQGSLVVLHGLMPHGSEANRSCHSRHAYTLHLIDASAHYPDDNWLQRPALPLRGFT